MQGGDDRSFAALCAVLDRPDLARDVRFARQPERWANRTDLLPLPAAAIEQCEVAPLWGR